MRTPTFRETEKQRYEQIKEKLFSHEARQNGMYKRMPRSFCLADEYSYENLYQGIRDFAISYFPIRGISWHDGLKGRHLPSNHLCCSQSCCVNFLFPLVKRPDLIKAIFSHYYPEIATALPITGDKPLTDGTYPCIAFEWIGTHDYLEEAKRKGMRRTRGANFTSADFIFRFRIKDGRIQIVLGEWKYTEEYRSLDKGIEVRKQNYRQAFNREGGVFKRRDADFYNALFFDPFYQLMRLQLLAQEMEFNREMDTDVVSVLLICPEANREFRDRVTSPYLAKMFPDKGIPEIWKGLVPEDKFKSITTEFFLDTIVQNVGPDEQEWAAYLKARYGWNTSD